MLGAELECKDLWIVPVGTMQILMTPGTQSKVNCDELGSAPLLGSRCSHLAELACGLLLALGGSCSDLGHVGIDRGRSQFVEANFRVVVLKVISSSIAGGTARLVELGAALAEARRKALIILLDFPVVSFGFGYRRHVSARAQRLLRRMLVHVPALLFGTTAGWFGGGCVAGGRRVHLWRRCLLVDLDGDVGVARVSAKLRVVLANLLIRRDRFRQRGAVRARGALLSRRLMALFTGLRVFLCSLLLKEFVKLGASRLCYYRRRLLAFVLVTTIFAVGLLGSGVLLGRGLRLQFRR